MARVHNLNKFYKWACGTGLMSDLEITLGKSGQYINEIYYKGKLALKNGQAYNYGRKDDLTPCLLNNIEKLENGDIEDDKEISNAFDGFARVDAQNRIDMLLQKYTDWADFKIELVKEFAVNKREYDIDCNSNMVIGDYVLTPIAREYIKEGLNLFNRVWG